MDLDYGERSGCRQSFKIAECNVENVKKKSRLRQFSTFSNKDRKTEKEISIRLRI